MAYTWSATARRDFKERERYREKNGEIDRYRKRGPADESAYAEELVKYGFMPGEERPWESSDWSLDAELSALTREEDADLSAANRIRAAFASLRNEMDGYDSDYDDLMASYQRLKDYSISSLLAAGTPTQGETGTVVVEKTEDVPITIDDVWKD